MGSPAQTVGETSRTNTRPGLQLQVWRGSLGGDPQPRMMGSWSVCPECGARQKLTRLWTFRRRDSFNFSHTQSQSQQSNHSQKDLAERFHRPSYHLFPSVLSSQASSQNDIYEDIEDSLPSLGSDPNSLYLCISEGRRNHLKSHKFVDWDYEERDIPAINHNNLQRGRVQLRKSLFRTCSTILETLKSIF